jgi:hypothetical protein
VVKLRLHHPSGDGRQDGLGQVGRPGELGPVAGGQVHVAARDDSWEAMVPAEVAELIKRRAFFGYVKPGRQDPE